MGRRGRSLDDVIVTSVIEASTPEHVRAPVQLWSVWGDASAITHIESGAYDEVVRELYEMGVRHRIGHPVTLACEQRLRAREG